MATEEMKNDEAAVVNETNEAVEKANVEMNEKAKKFQAYLEKNDIKAFAVEQHDDQLKTTIFRSHIMTNGQRLDTVVILDVSIYGLLRVNLGSGLVNDNNRQAVTAYLNQLNGMFKVFKYYCTENGTIVLDACICAETNQDCSDMIYSIINVLVSHLEEYYPKLMAKVWGAAV